MNRQQRMRLLENQLRAYTDGTIEYINDQWIFFDAETEEANLLDENLHQEIEVFRNSIWKKGILFEDGKVAFGDILLLLKDHDKIRIRKHLVYSLERLFEELLVDALVNFITTLNSLGFSIYDCIYCYNHLNFVNNTQPRSGVNFIVFIIKI